MPTEKPLVLLFAGSSGHGKTELARNLGRLLGLDFQAVNCTNLKWESDPFGPQAPYVANQDAQRRIVFLDEFEKTEDEVRKILLVPFDNGK
jgi:ATP-dependent Clp protease ATP-binding subunit ClpA